MSEIKYEPPEIGAHEILMTPESGAVIEVRVLGTCVRLAWATGRRSEDHADVECITEVYCGGITVEPSIGNAQKWRYPGETEWRR